MSRLSKINDLAFDLVHEYMEPSKQFSYGKQIYDLSDEPELNENQQIVLDWLKDEYCDGNPFFTIWHTLEDRYFKGSSDALLASQQIEILQAFSQWALEQEEAE